MNYPPTEKYVVVDTDMFSRLYRGDGVEQYRPLLVNVIPVLSFTSVAELHYGAEASHWGKRRRLELDQAIDRYLIAPYNPDMARLWATLKVRAKSIGHPLCHPEQSNDLWIAATAVHYKAPLLTGNRRHFADLPGLVLLPEIPAAPVSHSPPARPVRRESRADRRGRQSERATGAVRRGPGAREGR